MNDLNHRRGGADGKKFGVVLTLVLCFPIFSGCSKSLYPFEPAARQRVSAVGSRYRPLGQKPDLPALTSKSDLADYLRFAMLNNPRIEAAYYDWVAATEKITPARSLPDPRLRFQSDIADMVMSTMVGLMLDVPGPGKLSAAGRAAAAESEMRYYALQAEVLRTAYNVKSAYYKLEGLEKNLQVQRETLKLLSDIEEQARQQSAAGRATLQDVLRAQIEQEQLKTRIENLADSRSVLVAELKAALGLGPRDPSPPVPTKFTASQKAPAPHKILQVAMEHNPGIKKMEADVQRAQATLDLARKSRIPDFGFEMGADLKADPTIYSPALSLTLPIWRKKIAAEIAAAQAEKQAAEARLSNEQIQLAADLAVALYMYRESTRNIELLEQRLIPKGRQSLEAARTGYVSAKSGFLDVIDAYRQLLNFELALIDARTQKELALASLSLLIAGLPPDGSPTLKPDEPAIRGLMKGGRK